VRSLLELQRDFASDILSGTADKTGACLRSGKFSGGQLLQVYRNNFYLSLTKALRDIHPVVYKLVGDGFFNYTAEIYIRQHPSNCGNLHNFGSEFGNFISTFKPAADLPYLTDIARLDWACHLAFHAADAAKLAPEKLAQIPTERYGEMRLTISPSVSLLLSDYPIFNIWDFSNQDGDKDSCLDLDSGGQIVLVHRQFLDVNVLLLDADEYLFLSALTSGQSLLAAVETAVEKNAQFDLNAALSKHISIGTIVDVMLE
jgi:hypothetical protein